MLNCAISPSLSSAGGSDDEEEFKERMVVSARKEHTKREDYPNVKYWFKKDYKPTANLDKLTVPKARREKKIKPLDYLEEEDGSMCSVDVVKDVRDASYRIWNRFRDDRMAKGLPPILKWRQIGDELFKDYVGCMVTEFPQFALCENVWKLQYFATKVYPDYISGKKKSLNSKERSGRSPSPAPTMNLDNTSASPNMSSSQPATTHLQVPVAAIPFLIPAAATTPSPMEEFSQSVSHDLGTEIQKVGPIFSDTHIPMFEDSVTTRLISPSHQDLSDSTDFSTSALALGGDGEQQEKASTVGNDLLSGNATSNLNHIKDLASAPPNKIAQLCDGIGTDDAIQPPPFSIPTLNLVPASSPIHSFTSVSSPVLSIASISPVLSALGANPAPSTSNKTNVNGEMPKAGTPLSL